MINSKLLLPLLFIFYSTTTFAQPKIIFDTDFGGDADDLGALAMLHNFIDKGESKLSIQIQQRISFNFKYEMYRYQEEEGWNKKGTLGLTYDIY